MSEVELLSKIAWIIGAIIIVIAGVGCVTLIGAWSLDSIIRFTKFGKEFSSTASGGDCKCHNHGHRRRWRDERANSKSTKMAELLPR